MISRRVPVAARPRLRCERPPAARILLAAALVLLAAAGSASAFEGRLIDRRTGAPVEGATVSIVGYPGSVQTDADGRFAWQPDPAAPLEIVVVLPGGEVARPVRLEFLDHAAVTTIEIEALVDESVTVAGVAPSIDATPAAGMTLLPQVQIERRAPANVVEALAAVPGVSGVSEGHAAVPAVRGLARGRTLVLLDGARVTTERRVGAGANFLDPSVLGGIDVARGPGSVAYGSDALGGVVSLRTRRPEPGAPWRTRVTAAAGWGVPEWRSALAVSRGFTRGGVLVHAHARSAADYRAADGADVLNSSWRDEGVLVRGEHGLGAGLAAASYQGDFARDVGRPRDNSDVERFYYPRDDAHRVTLSYEEPGLWGLERVALTGFFGRSRLVTDQDRAATASAPRTVRRADVEADDAQLRAVAESHAGPARLEFGLDLVTRRGLRALDSTLVFAADGTPASESVTVSIDDARRLDAGAFVQAQAAFGPTVAVSAGVRGDRVTTDNEGGFFGDLSTEQSSVSGFAGVTLGPFRGWSVTAQAARGFRDPTLSDRYFVGPTGRGTVTGNPDLQPETSLQFDLALRATVGPVRAAAYAYHYDIDDLVERYETAPDEFAFRNRGSAEIRGLELELQATLARGLVLDLAAQASRGRAEDEATTDLDDIPPPSVALTLRRDFDARFYAEARGTWFEDDDRPGPSEVAADSYAVVDLGAGWQVTPAAALRLQLRNLLDEAYYASPDPRRVLAPGRSAVLGATLQF